MAWAFTTPERPRPASERSHAHGASLQTISRRLRGPRIAAHAPRRRKFMSTTMWILLIVVLVLVFGGGGGYYWSRNR
jgi:hypothetical protein